jgi:hypothetical protein
MKTKKLVLGFCALAAIAGGVPQVFGGVLDKLREIVLKGKDGTLSDDGARQEKYENLLKDAGKRVDEENRILTEMRMAEVTNIKNALDLEHHAHFRRGIAAAVLEVVRKEADTVQRELTKAKENASAIGFFKFRAKKEAEAKIKALELKLEDALARPEVLQECKNDYDKAENDMKLARSLRRQARSLREQRIARFANLVNSYIDERGGEDCQEVDRTKLENPGCAIVQKEMIRVNALRDLIFWASDDGSVEWRVTAQIEKAIKRHTDDSVGWDRWITSAYCEDVRLLTVEHLGEGYHPIEPDYDYKDLTKFAAQTSRIDAVFGGANELQGDTRLHWEGEDAEAGIAADSVV